MFEGLKNIGSSSSDKEETVTASTVEPTTTVETPKPKKSKKPDKPQKPLARDAPKELQATGKFFGGVAEMKIDKTDLEMPRVQRIILEDKHGKHYEFLRSKNPY